MLRIVAAVAIIWLALMPPLFTAGACTAEFEREMRRLGSDRKSLSSPALAASYWSARRVPFAVIAADQCRKAKPRFLLDMNPYRSLPLPFGVTLHRGR